VSIITREGIRDPRELPLLYPDCIVVRIAKWIEVAPVVQTVLIPVVNWIIPKRLVEIQPTLFLNRVAIDPPS
jgi:hypothetical protein